MEITENQEYFIPPRIGDKAPEFQAITTQGKLNFPSDYHGEWSILFSHPADFTPVCTSEFMVFASMQKKFSKANCHLVGLSVDSIFSHIAWLRTIKEKIEFKGIKNIDINFPLIEDISMRISMKYGMIMPNESNDRAVRAVFFIDPEGIIRAIIYYPFSLGRNFDEIYRALIALQTADEFHVATPADWKPGDKVIVSPASTCKEAARRMDGEVENLDCNDWFFCTKDLDKAEILEKVTHEPLETTE